MRRGFTLVELVVVIVVIGILTTIVTLGLTRYQAQARDNQRSAKAISIAEALEKYYDKNGEYPPCQSLTGTPSTVTGSTGPLAGLNSDVLVTPRAQSGVQNSITCTSLAPGASDDTIAYVGDNSSSCQTSSCLQFTIQYRSDQDGSIKTITSRRQQNVNTSGAVALTTGAVTYTSAIVNWNAISNATGYIIQRDTVSTFNSPNLTTTNVSASTLSYTFSDLSPGATTYYQVQAVSSTGNSNWSNTVQQTTSNLPTLTLVNTQNTPSQVTETWSTGPGSLTYTIQRASNAGFTGTVTSDTGTFTSRVYSDTPVAVMQYYRVQANTTNSVGTTFSGPWTTISYQSYVPAPSTPGTSASMSGTNAVGVAGSASCSQGATIQYAIRETHKANSGNADSWSALTAWQSTPPTLTVAGLQGNQHTFQSAAQCVYSGVTSTITYGTTASPVRGINAPPTPTWPSGLSKSWANSSTGHYMWYGTYCPDGTWVDETWFHSHPSWGSDFYHTFGFNDWWTLGPSGGANVYYWAMYTCVSSYAGESAWSAQSYDIIWVS